MSEPTTDAAEPTATPTPPRKPATRASKPAPARGRSHGNTSPPPYGGAQLASLSRLAAPGGDDPFQSGQRLWPD